MGQGENWVDYKEIKAKVSMAVVLGHYGLFDKLKQKGNNVVGCCPIHKGSNVRQFSVNLERNIWNCFGDCKSGGNVLDFVAKMEGVSIHEAALLLKKWAPDAVSESKGGEIPKKDEKLVREENKGQKQERATNPPLTFELKNLASDHAFFTERGIEPETVKHFGLGFCTKGILKDRIAIPIHNERGELVAYCGRAVSQEQIEAEGKYKLPPGFAKSLVVYNLNRQTKKVRRLILVESYLSVFKLQQAGHANTVALMGSSLSEEQAGLIASFLGPKGQALLLFDGDEDGEACTKDCLDRLGRQVFVKALDINPYARKPHQLSPSDLARLL